MFALKIVRKSHPRKRSFNSFTGCPCNNPDMNVSLAKWRIDSTRKSLQFYWGKAQGCNFALTYSRQSTINVHNVSFISFCAHMTFMINTTYNLEYREIVHCSHPGGNAGITLAHWNSASIHLKGHSLSQTNVSLHLYNNYPWSHGTTKTLPTATAAYHTHVLFYTFSSRCGHRSLPSFCWR